MTTQLPGDGKCLTRLRDDGVPSRPARADPGDMSPGNIAAGIEAAVIAACLLSIVTFFLLAAAAAAATIARARHRAKHRPELLIELAHGATVGDLAEIDDRLDQVLARER